LSEAALELNHLAAAALTAMLRIALKKPIFLKLPNFGAMVG
jgi:hypothetical protein